MFAEDKNGGIVVSVREREGVEGRLVLASWYANNIRNFNEANMTQVERIEVTYESSTPSFLIFKAPIVMAGLTVHR